MASSQPLSGGSDAFDTGGGGTDFVFAFALVTWGACGVAGTCGGEGAFEL